VDASKKDGTPVPVEVAITVLPDEEGREQLYVVWRDISARRKAEQKLMESLREKEALLSEIHHRVKNNLAVISGLMQLQIYTTEDEKVDGILNSSINRIKSMALIHEQLYQSENFSNISLKENILKQAESIKDVFIADDTPSVKLNLELEDISIGINQAMPVGLLVNEILINAFKHAFKGKDKGEISVHLFEENSRIHLKIADNGVGFEPAEEESGSLGTTLIKTFADQLEANLAMENSQGTTYKMSFKRSEVKGSVASYNI